MRKLKLFLLTALTMLTGGGNLAWGQGWTASEVAAGDFYLYNVGAKGFLTAGGRWGTHAVISNEGSVVTLAKINDGVYTIATPHYHGSTHWFADNGYVDSNETNWTFEAVPGLNNTFKLKNGDNYARVETGLYNVMIGADTGNSKSYWKLVTAANRSDNSVSSTSNPIDRSYLITNARFETNTTGWNGECTRVGNGKDDNNNTAEANWNTHNACVEHYHATTDVYQTLEGLTNGKYIVKCQGFYRKDSGSEASYLYANNESVALNLKTGTGDPNNVSQASTHFSNDEYWNSVTVNVTDGTLKIGVKTTSNGNWTIFDNFQLYYCGNDCSSSITNAGFDSNTGGWTGLGAVSNSEVEYYGGNESQKTFDLYQDLTGLTAGIYAVEVQGYYRNGAGIDDTRRDAGENMYALLYAKGEDGVERNTALQSIYSEAGNCGDAGEATAYFGKMPNWMNQAQEYISAGLYNDNKVIVEVGEAGTLRIGAKKTTAVTNDWTILDNFSLTKLTYSTLAEAYAAEWSARKAKAQALLDGYTNIVSGATVRTALASAVAATPSDMEGYTAALTTLRSAVNNFEAAKYAFDLYATKAAAATEVFNAEGTTYVNVTGDEKTTFNTAYSTNVSSFSPATKSPANYYAAATAIAAATAAFTVESIKNNYDEYAAEVATATLLGTDISEVATPTSSAAALSAAHAINVLNYNKVVTEEYEDVSETSLGAWTDTNVISRRSQHWDGTTDEKTGTEYFEMSSGWGDTSWTMSRSQNVSLSAGKYILKVAARVSPSANATLSVTVGGSTISTISGHQGDNGKGITVEGVASYNEGTFANTTGRGFEWKYIPFELDETGTATLSFTAEGHALYQYVSFTSLALLTDPKVAARTSLLNKINDANTEYASGANVGSGAFQIPSAAATSFCGAISTAQGIYDNEDASLEDITKATTDLNGAITTYQNTTLNSPDAEKSYALLVKSGSNRNKVIAAATGETGNYNPTGYSFSANNDLADGVQINFTQVSGNNYNISFSLGGSTIYLTYGSVNGSTAGWATQQIQGTTDGENKRTFRIVKTTTDCVFKIYNTVYNDYIDCQDGGSLYTDTGIGNELFTLHEITDVAISEATTSAPAANPLANVTLTRTLTKDSWNTFCVPFNLSAAQIAASALNGATIKQFASSEDNVINLKAATSIVAGEPYLVKPSTTIENPTFNYVVVENTDGVVKGEGDYQFVGQVYNKSLATDGTVAYLSTSGSIKKLTSGGIKGLRAYFMIPVSGAPARIAFLDEDDTTTGITEMQTENTATNTKAYDLSGRRVEAMKKGIYIVNGKKVVK